MITRYTRPEFGKIWSDENKFQKWLDVEIAVCVAQAELGLIPQSAIDSIKNKAKFNTSRVLEIETEVKHDVIAFLTNVAEYVGEDSRYIHLGMTSNDVLDTSLSILLREAGEILVSDLKTLQNVVKNRAIEFKYTPCIGRTHGVHAEPITFGLKLALWYDEIGRNLARLKEVIDGISVIKISGAVGTFQHLDPRVEEKTGHLLGLKPVNATQVVPRDLHADFLSTLAVIGASIEKFATEIRSLQRTEILEAEEYFSKGQKGSSAMPHKRNPITCERVTGLARLLRSNAMAALENVALWHERDITHSSVERVILPDSTILLDYMLTQFTHVIERLLIYPDHMLKNINKTRGLIFSQPILLALANKGMRREAAYKVVQESAMEVWQSEKSDFKEVISKNEIVRKLLSEQDINECFDMSRSLQHIDYLFERSGIK
ncbi:adenylosuccinate lyase [bacterium]|nr:MAG: adenylosuccinate lyase [bacterium]